MCHAQHNKTEYVCDSLQNKPAGECTPETFGFMLAASCSTAGGKMCLLQENRDFCSWHTILMIVLLHMLDRN